MHFAFVGCAKTAPTVTPATPGTLASRVDPVTQLQQDILNATRRPGVTRGAWGIVVQSLAREERLFELNPHILLVPASSAKLVSAATAAEAVGWGYRFTTTLRSSGSLVDGVLKGDLLVVGSGDPSIGGRGGDDLSALSEGLNAAGVRRIEGRIIGDDDTIEEPRPQLSWAWDDLGYTAGALFGALNLAENRTSVTIAPGAEPGDPAAVSIDPRAQSRSMVNRVVTGPVGSPPLVWPEQRPGETPLTIAGSIPAGGVPVTMGISVGNPTLWFASVLRARLIRDGIEVTGEAVDIDDVTPTPIRSTMPVLFTYASRPLSEIARPLLKDSINVYGEALMRLNAPSSLPTNDAALEALRKRLESWGIPGDSQQLVDGSGLSRRNAIAPEALIAVLRRMHDPTGQSPFVAGLPIAGVDGSLAGRMKGTPAEGNVRAKTGTMSNVRSLSGYATTRDGEPLAFVIMVNNFEGSGASATEAVDAIAIRLASFTR